MPLLTASSLTEGGEVGGIKIAGPQPNSYQTSTAMSTNAIKEQTSMLGHNSFRPDIYKVSGGYVA
jgi:hypothetical protein